MAAGHARARTGAGPGPDEQTSVLVTRDIGLAAAIGDCVERFRGGAEAPDAPE